MQRYTCSSVHGMTPDDDGQWVSLEDYNALFNTCDTWRDRYAAMKKRCLVAEEEQAKLHEQLAQWMLSQSIPTGHGDDMGGLLEELTLWVEERRAERDRYKAALEEIVSMANVWNEAEVATAREALGGDCGATSSSGV